MYPRRKFPQDEEYQTRGKFAVQAVKNGFIALAIEQRGMGERRLSERHQNAANMCEYAICEEIQKMGW